MKGEFDRALIAKKGQVAIFIIIAIVLVAVIGVVFFVVKNPFESSIPKNIEPVYSYYLSCIENEVSNGAYLMGQGGGYIEMEFSPGSEYMPFSNQLDFLGIGVPYWFYISGNNVKKEQVPSKEKMEEQLNVFLEGRLQDCDFSEFEEQGFAISYGLSEVESEIKDNKIKIDVEQDLSIGFGNTTWTSGNFDVEVDSHLGEFYDLSKEIYEHNQESMFLENYGIDILRLNAPVDGSDIGCSPKIWNVNEIREDLINALSENVPFIKIKGDYYSLSEKENKYFVQDIGNDVKYDVNFMFLKKWPVKVDVWPSENGILRADPVGLQEGLGMLGFCYVPYHFVYDFAYPVLIQIYSESEIFQFPIVVYIDKNQARSATGESLPDVVPELCKHKLTEMDVLVYNSDLESVGADISFKCFDTSCDIGSASEGSLNAKFPQCKNGYIIASAEGYETKKQLVSTIDSGEVIVILRNEYDIDLNIGIEGSEYAVVSFSRKDIESGDVEKSVVVAYPEQESVSLVEGLYDIKAYVYSDSSIDLPSSNLEKCVDVPKGGVWSVFGMTEEKCFDIEVPEQVVGSAITGGGSQEYFVSETDLEMDVLNIDYEEFGSPTSVEGLQENYNSLEVSRLNVWFS